MQSEEHDHSVEAGEIHTSNIVFTLEGMIVGICILFILLFVLNYFNIIQLSIVHPFFSFLPHKVVSSTPSSSIITPLKTSTNICIEQLSSYPQISDILTSKEHPDLGVYQGVITTVNASQHTFSVISTPSRHSFVFNLNAKSTPIYDIHRSVITNIAALPIPSKVVISFPCIQQQNSFVLTQVQLVK